MDFYLNWITVFILQCLSLSFSFKCPMDDNSISIDGAYRDPKICGTYYQCVNGTAYPHTCPPGLFFRFKTVDCIHTTCVDPKFADCPNNYNPIVDEPKDLECKPNENNFQTSCFKKTEECSTNLNGTVASLFDCRVYYHCYNGLGWPQQCPPGYAFDPVVNSRECTVRLCIPAKDAKCPQDGNWSKWSAWEDCKVPCGEEGVVIRTRKCNNPPPSNGGRQCPGSSFDAKSCQNLDCGGPAFMSSLKSVVTFNQERVRWDSIDLNQQNLFNHSTNELSIKEYGVYFLSMIATMDIDSGTHLVLENVGKQIDLKRERNELNLDIISRSGLFHLNPIFKPYIRQSLPTSTLIGSSLGKDTSWLGFKYPTTNYVFAGSDRQAVSGSYIPFNILVNMRGFTMSNFNTQFNVIETGPYFINFGCNFQSNSPKIVSLFIHFRNDHPNTIARHTNSISSSDQLSRSSIRRLHTGSTIQYTGSQDHNSTTGMPVYLLAYKLNESLPLLYVHQIPQVTPPCPGSRLFVNFQVVVDDTTNSWDVAKSQYKVPMTGTYYIDISIVVKANQSLEVGVEVNNVQRFQMTKLRKDHSESDLISRGALLQMYKDDILKLRYTGCITVQRMVSSMTIFLVP